MAEDSQTHTKAAASGFAESAANMEHIINQQWASSILWLAAPEDAASLSRPDAVSLPETVDHAAFRAAAEEVRAAVAQEIRLHLDNLPPSLAEYARGTRPVGR